MTTDNHADFREAFVSANAVENKNWVSGVAAEIAAAIVIEFESHEAGDIAPASMKHRAGILADRIIPFFGDRVRSKVARPIGTTLAKAPEILVSNWLKWRKPDSRFYSTREIQFYLWQILRNIPSQFAGKDLAKILAIPIDRMIAHHYAGASPIQNGG